MRIKKGDFKIFKNHSVYKNYALAIPFDLKLYSSSELQRVEFRSISTAEKTSKINEKFLGITLNQFDTVSYFVVSHDETNVEQGICGRCNVHEVNLSISRQELNQLFESSKFYDYYSDLYQSENLYYTEMISSNRNYYYKDRDQVDDDWEDWEVFSHE